MIKYKLTKKGKIVILMLCAFIIFFIALGGSINNNVPKYDDYSKPSNDEQQQATTPEPPPVIVEEEEPWKDQRVAVFFEANMTSLNKQFYDALNGFSDIALQYDNIGIQVEGNCATLFPTNQKQKSINYNLSLLRAQAIVDYMKSRGISSERFTVIANGSDKPLKDNSSLENRKLNRRVDVFFVNR
ncbi:MAG: cell envelope biosis protein OmpA [Clostridia bacterium]|nr:cell envelope biosis protein OmpA [Clostridia bacterium]